MGLDFAQHNQKATEFIKEVARELETPGDVAYADRLVKSVLSVLREMIQPEESLNLVSSLPMYLQGLLLDGWKMTWDTKRIETREEFFDELREKYPRTTGRPLGDYQSARKDVKAVLRVLQKYVPEGEVLHVKTQLSPPIAELWDKEEYEER
ncbi:DUF2267 domain-containing protein [Pontibacter korlensis]|uniref:DUF2267 domain-containing protein n=1 Tax=Pontibacter korlensis TaxID=400092 RepID=A0A0E3ZH55_9BACT|nr:DUF2267 domain-containing protein [Pontibacter korlensis]AKD05345.1 hypothetical protein PKOR_22715 [Pontibacter korlensis]